MNRAAGLGHKTPTRPRPAFIWFKSKRFGPLQRAEWRAAGVVELPQNVPMTLFIAN